MIDITIKTLDSRNHLFSVEDELTVKQLKERIAEPVNVPVESQRLIYCGRVLVDEKKLSEYDVHGKVIHLVQRAPPSAPQDNPPVEPRATSTPRRAPFRTIIAPGRVDAGGGNAMYLGAMAFPADLMDAQGFSPLDYLRISMPQPRHRLSQSRLTVARGMLRRARYTLLNLENPSHSDSDTDTPNENANPEDRDDLINEIVADITASTSNVGVQHPPPHINVEGNSRAPGAEGEMQAEEAEHTPERSASDESPSGEETAPPNASGENNENIRNGRYRFPGPHHMAEIIFFVRDIERRLNPYLERFYDLVSSDPSLESPARVQNAQRLFDEVSKVMHFLAHAYHAISDIMCDFNQAPPRRLRCRPVLIQHSAVLQTGIPLQAQLNVGGNSVFAAAANAVINNNNQTPPASTGSSSDTAAAPEPRTTETAPPVDPINLRSSSQSQSQSSSQGSTTTESSGRSGNLSGGNFEVYMDVGQGSITIDSVEATLVTGGQGGSGGASISTGSFPWGTPPPEFLQNLMQELAGHMLGGSSSSSGGGSSSSGGSGGASSAATTSAPSSSSSSGGSSNAPEGASNATNSQARGNTSTQPTTSTQTRSTTRPHVHISPGFQGREHRGPGFFDPFLPCNSHHIHGSRRRTAEAQETATNNNNSSTSNQSTSQSTGTSTENQSRPTMTEIPTFLNIFSNILSGMRAGNVQGQGQPSLIRILPRDITVFLQGSPSVQNMNLNRDTTVAELLQSLPDHSYTEGTSIFSDLLMTLARNLRVVEVLNMGSANSSVLTNLRPVLREFIRTRLLEGREGNQAVSDAVNRINTELRPLIESILSQEDIPFREDVDIVATINQLNHTTIPVLIRDVLEEDNNQYLRNIPNHCNDYARHLASILFHCCHNGQQGLEAIYTILARRVIVGVPSALQNWSVVHIVNQLRAMANVLETSREAIQPFLVYRMADAPVNEATEPLSQAMETEADNDTGPGSTRPEVLTPPGYSRRIPHGDYSIWRYAAAPGDRILTPIACAPPEYSPRESHPDLHAGSSVPSDYSPSSETTLEYSPLGVITNPREIANICPPIDIERDLTWHGTVPPDWVPIINRDRERQRRQAVQGALSDAYLAGMPSKRRKMVTSAKPHTNLARVISESMNSALGAAGVDGAEPGLAETAGGDTSLRAAYKEQVRNTLTPTLRQHPDFTPEKYPAAAKLFTSK